jgi:hypothetical protein
MQAESMTLETDKSQTKLLKQRVGCLRGSNDQQTSSKTKEKRKKTEIINIRSEI